MHTIALVLCRPPRPVLPIHRCRSPQESVQVNKNEYHRLVKASKVSEISEHFTIK